MSNGSSVPEVQERDIHVFVLYGGDKAVEKTRHETEEPTDGVGDSNDEQHQVTDDSV